MKLEEITLYHFKSLEGSSIDIQFTNDVIMPAEVLSVTELSGYSPLDRSPFSIIFRTNQKTNYYQQGTYLVHHPDLHEIFMFLSPKGFDNVGMKYEAIFS